jgi:hypothetical protein
LKLSSPKRSKHVRVEHQGDIKAHEVPDFGKFEAPQRKLSRRHKWRT